jgi:hypothetical protein
MESDKSIEADIFDAAPVPEPQAETLPSTEVVVPDAQEAALASNAIATLQREQGGPTSRALVPAPRADPPSQGSHPSQGSQSPPAPTTPGFDPNGILADLREERRARQDLERQIRELRHPPKPEVPFNQRVFEDPEPTIDQRVQQHLSPLTQYLQTTLTDLDFKIARRDHGEKFDQAYQAWFERVGNPQAPDPQTYWAIMASPSPGEALVRWHRGQRMQQTIGDEDPDAFRERIERETLARYGLAPDSQPAAARPAAASQASQASQASRLPNGQFAPRQELRLPTATSRGGHTSREAAYAPEDGSEEAIFDFGRAKSDRR